MSDEVPKDYNYSRDWLQPHLPQWTRYLIGMSGAFAPMRFLEIGVYEGRSSCWFLDNILTLGGDEWHGIDPWELSAMSPRKFPRKNGRGERMIRNVEATARHYLSPYGAKAVIHKGRSQDILIDPELREQVFRPESFGIIYVDGSHLSNDVAMDSIATWPMVQPGGLLIWDDYRMKRHQSVCNAVDRFLECIPGKYEIVYKRIQLCIRKLK